MIKLQVCLISLKLPSCILRISLGRILPWAWFSNTDLHFANKKSESYFVCYRYEDNEVEGGRRGATYWQLPRKRCCEVRAHLFLSTALLPSYSQGNWRSENFSYLPKVTRLVNTRQLRENQNKNFKKRFFSLSEINLTQIPCFSPYVNYTVSLRGHKRGGSRSSRPGPPGH